MDKGWPTPECRGSFICFELVDFPFTGMQREQLSGSPGRQPSSSIFVQDKELCHLMRASASNQSYSGYVIVNLKQVGMAGHVGPKSQRETAGKPINRL
jgi:hypothetical protein